MATFNAILELYHWNLFFRCYLRNFLASANGCCIGRSTFRQGEWSSFWSWTLDKLGNSSSSLHLMPDVTLLTSIWKAVLIVYDFFEILLSRREHVFIWPWTGCCHRPSDQTLAPRSVFHGSLPRTRMFYCCLFQQSAFLGIVLHNCRNWGHGINVLQDGVSKSFHFLGRPTALIAPFCLRPETTPLSRTSPTTDGMANCTLGRTTSCCSSTAHVSVGLITFLWGLSSTWKSCAFYASNIAWSIIPCTSNKRTQRSTSLFATFGSLFLLVSVTASTFSASSLFWAVLVFFIQCLKQILTYAADAAKECLSSQDITTYTNDSSLLLRIGVQLPDLLVKWSDLSPWSTSGAPSFFSEFYEGLDLSVLYWETR